MFETYDIGTRLMSLNRTRIFWKRIFC